MDLRRFAVVLFSLLLPGTICAPQLWARQNEVQDFYSTFADEVFRCQNETCDVKGKEFVIVLRYTRTMRLPDAQITISKFSDGHAEATFSRVPKPLSAYFPDEYDSKNLTADQIKSLARNVPLKQRELQLRDNEWQGILTDYKNLRISPMIRYRAVFGRHTLRTVVHRAHAAGALRSLRSFC